MVRHGKTAWNKENKLCGWFDAPSSKKGIQEVHNADQTLKRKGYQFDTGHTSVLTRAQHTLKVILEQIEQSSLPVKKSWRLRGIVKHLDKLSDEATMGVNLLNRIPFAYEHDDNLKPIKCMQFLGD
ncbi:2,3-bisphosphoglycerate-dependent phosphoglycerate mutase-like [Artemia franciscana]|uniref:2,3-bisphosphoglycerate-dependent phosphoglycerate mutase-like n=1 Tax=Artemia franciscana TaxID=6661 RepID=UPI0032DBB202